MRLRPLDNQQARLLLTHQRNHNLPLVRGAAVFEEEQALPGAKAEVASNDGHNLAGGGQDGSEMGCHIVRTFQRVDKTFTVFGSETFEIMMEVRARGRVGIFEDDQAGAGVLDENGGSTGQDPTQLHHAADRVRDLIGAFTRSRDGEFLTDCFHQQAGRLFRAPIFCRVRE